MEKFSFIKDTSLREKLKETYNYIKFLLSLEKKSLSNDILISLNRDIIIHTTSILEGLLTYLLITIVDKGTNKELIILNNILTKKEYIKVNSFKNLTLYDENEKLYLTKIKETKGKINGKLNLGILIKFIIKLKIFDIDIAKGLEDIQKIRNDLHIQKVLDDDLYQEELTDKKLLELFDFTRKIQNKIVEKLNSLEKLIEIEFDLDIFIKKLKENGAKGALTMTIRGSNLFIEKDILKIKPRTTLSMNILRNSENIELLNKISNEIGLKGAQLY